MGSRGGRRTDRTAAVDKSQDKESVSSFGKTYFVKYIQDTNKKLYELKMQKRRKFIPEVETEKKTY